MKSPDRIIIILGLALILIIGLGFVKNQFGLFVRLQTALQNQSISAGMLDYGTMGQILKRLGIVRLIENDFNRFKKTDNKDNQLDVVTFQKKRQVSEHVYVANPLAQTAFTSTQYIQSIITKKDWPIISIGIDPKHLNDPDKGIWVNREKKGQEWERIAEISYMENGEIQFETYAGLRMHGGKRLTTQKFKPGFRLYFRKKYGLKAVPNRLVLPDLEIPLRTVVVQTTAWPPGFPINNPLAFDVSTQIGCKVPATRLVEIYLNGESYGMGYAMEHLSRRQWGQRFGHEDYLFFVWRKKNPIEDSVGYARKIRTAIENDFNPYLETVSKDVDIDNLSRQIISWIYSGTSDYCQGVAAFDRKNQDAKLFWINWDMDQSFWDKKALVSNLARENWEQSGFKLFYQAGGEQPRDDCWRVNLYHRLLNESIEFRQEFISLFIEILNHRLTQEFLHSRLKYYQTMLAAYGEPHYEYMTMLENFIMHRHDYLLNEAKDEYSLIGPFTCKVIVPSGVSIIVDGYSYEGNYQGKYFLNTPVQLTISDEYSDNFKYWLVNGKNIYSKSIQLQLVEDINVVAFYNHD